MLETEPGNNKAILVISDGGFEDASAIATAKKLAGKELSSMPWVSELPEGAPSQIMKGMSSKKMDVPILSKLEKERLSEISNVGNGRYLEGTLF